MNTKYPDAAYFDFEVCPPKVRKVVPCFAFDDGTTQETEIVSFCSQFAIPDSAASRSKPRGASFLQDNHITVNIAYHVGKLVHGYASILI